MLPVLLAFVVCGVLGGFAWSKVSARLRLREMVAMLTSPLASGLVTFACLFIYSCVKVGWLALTVSNFRFSSLSGRNGAYEGSYIGFLLTTGFGGGMLLGGLPSILGWMLGWRKPAYPSTEEDQP